MQATTVPCLSSFDLRMTPPPEKEPKLAAPAMPTISASSPNFTPKSLAKPRATNPDICANNNHSRDRQRPTQPNRSSWTYQERCILTPRPYEEIYSERAYLSSTIQTYSARLAGYIRDYSCLEAKLQQGVTGQARRKLRKKVELMRARISEASQQERAIFNRLGELFLELHSRDLWNAAYTKEARSWITPQPEAEFPCTQSPNSASSGRSTSSLNPESPVFVPQSKLKSDREKQCDHRRMSSLETVPELVQEEEEEGEEASTSSVKAIDDGDDGFAEEPVEHDTPDTTEGANPHKEDPDCLEKGPDDDGWRYVHVLAEDQDIVVEELGSKRWSLPVMRYTWPTE